MSKYSQLYEHLARRADSEWGASFSEIEAILGFRLPKSAQEYPAWWANQTGEGHSQSSAWQKAGWQTSDLDLRGRFVRFRRVKGGRSDQRQTAMPSEVDNLFEAARTYTGIQDEDLLIREAMKALIEREAGQRLARLGGTMPDFEAPPRQRFDR